jgi:3-oxoacyl-[acyl-carrier protein] reductase
VTERRAAWDARPRLFADEGARVAVVDVNASGVDAVVDEIGSAGGQVRGFAVDRQAREYPAAHSPTSSLIFGGLDILIRTVAR